MADGDEPIGRPRRRIRPLGGVHDSTSGSPQGLNEEVEDELTVPRILLSDSDSDVGSRTDAPSDFTPRNRLEEAARGGGRATNAEREYRLKLLHRMLMRNVPLMDIARELGVSLSTVQRDRKELYDELAKAAGGLDVKALLGEALGFYGEVRGMALRSASAQKVPMQLRLAALRTALAAHNDMARFMETTGVFDVLRFRATKGESDSDIEKLVGLTEKLLGLEGPDEEILKSVADKDNDIDMLRIL